MTYKISILLPDLRGGGVERIRLVLAHEFVRAGRKVEFVLVRAQGELLEEARASFPVVDLGSARLGTVPFALTRYLRQCGPDALLAAMWPLTVIAPLTARMSGHHCHVVVSEHNSLSEQYRDWGRLNRVAMMTSMAVGYRLADHRVGVSEGVLADIAALSRLSSEAFKVIYNPVSPRRTPTEDELRWADALWSVPEGGRIVTVGSMKAQKNHPLLLRAFAQIDRPEARLMFVGDGGERQSLLSLARDLGVTGRVIFAGFHSDPTPFYETADLFVLSSNYEGFGNVIVEAMACGTPVVSTDCPFGPSEILENGRFGRLVPVGDAEALASAMTTALDVPSDRSALKRRAADFSPELKAREYLDLMESK